MKISKLKTIYFLQLSLIVCFALVPCECKRYRNFLGPFRIIPKMVTNCPPEFETNKEKLEYKLHDSRKRRTELLRFSGWASMPFAMNDTLAARIKVASWSNMGGWKDNAHILNFKELCKTLEFLVPTIWHIYLKSIYGEVLYCPFFPGKFYFENVTADTSNIPVKYFMYGRWRGDGQILYSNGDVAACLRVFADTVPV